MTVTQFSLFFECSGASKNDLGERTKYVFFGYILASLSNIMHGSIKKNS